MAVYTAAQLIVEVRRRAMVPNAQASGSLDADILAMADVEIETRLYPLVMQLQQEYFVDEKQVSIGSVSNNQISAIAIPWEASLGKVRDVLFMDANRQLYNLPRIASEDEWKYTKSYTQATVLQQRGIPSGFTIVGNYIRLLPLGAYPNNCRLIVRYYRRPAQLGGSVAQITRNVTVPSTVTGINSQGVDLVFGTPLVAGQYAFYRYAPPFELFATLTTVAASATAVTVYPFQAGAGFSSNTEVAAVLLQAGASGGGLYVDGSTFSPFLHVTPFIPLPPEFSQLLVQRTVCRYLQAQRDTEGLAIAERDADAMEKSLVLAASERVDGEPRRIVGGLYQSMSNFNGWMR